MGTPFRLRAVEPSEAQTLDAILRYLRLDRRIAWAERFNTGAHVVENLDARGRKQRRFIRYAFAGCSDILGQLVDGRFLAIEVKSPTGRPTAEQSAFLALVSASRGVAILARSIEDIRAALDHAHTHNKHEKPNTRSELQRTLDVQATECILQQKHGANSSMDGGS